MTRIFLFASVGCLAACLAASATPLVTLSLTPSGTVSGMPNGSVGWGFSLTNNTDEYLVVQNSLFCAGTEETDLTTCAPSLSGSTYSDSIANNFTEVAPNSTLDEPFSADGTSGIGSYTIGAAASGSDIGSIAVIYDLYTTDFYDPNYMCCQDGGDSVVTAAAEVDVLGTTAPTPEPRDLGLVAGGLLLVLVMFLGGRRARRVS